MEQSIHRSPVLVAMGARSSLGASALAIGAAFHAGISRHRQWPSLLGRSYRPLVVACDPLVPSEVPVERRMMEMVTHAALEAVESFALHAPQVPLDVVVAVPEARLDVGLRMPERVVGALEDCLCDRVRLGALEVRAGGRSAGILALGDAVRRLEQGRTAACLCCGVDSYLAPATLDMLDRAGSLHTDDKRWGFVPGEGAGACLLVASDTVERLGFSPLAFVRAAVTEMEVCDAAQGEVALGQALTTATRTVLEMLPQHEQVHRVYADLNGERERVDEVGFTLTRIASRVAALPCLVTPADRLGEVGAASAALFASLSVTAAQRGRAPGPNIIICTTGAGALRGAALLHVPVRRREE